MAPLILEGETLGKKHKHYNKLLKDAVSGNLHLETPHPEDDISNLFLIDIACEKKDVTFILDAFKSSDMLYVSRAIKKSTWLITDKSYKHIINPDYLHAELFPQMMTKAIKKILLHIRLHIKDEERAEEFYRHEKDENVANKWLCNCSAKFIEENIKKDHYYDSHILKRLCEKSINILEKSERFNSEILKETMFFLNSETNRYLNIIEKVSDYNRPHFNAKATKFLMKNCSDRIINNFAKYANNIHIPTFIKYIKSKDIADFLIKQVKEAEDNRQLGYLLRSEKIFNFFERIPPSERYELVKRLFLEEKVPLTEKDSKIKILREFLQKSIKKYEWYKYAPFDVAFVELRKLIQVETSDSDKNNMLDTLISCANQNSSNIETLLKYYKEKHIKDSISSKYQFMNELNDKTEIYKYNKKLWNIIDSIFRDMDLYKESTDIHSLEKLVEITIAYKVLHNETVPEVIMNKFKFQTLSYHRKKISNEDGEKLFTFLYSYLLAKLEKTVSTVEEFVEHKNHLIYTLTLIEDWKKDLSSFPNIINKIKETVSLKKERSWTIELADLYNTNKTWRKLMFEESIFMDPSADTCVNALKHGPNLLTRYYKEVQSLQSDDSICLKLALQKIRIYWSDSLALAWSNDYKDRLKIPKNYKALTRGMCYLLPHTNLIEIIVSYAPTEDKIDYNSMDELKLSLQMHFAKNMHLARPQPCPDIVLNYAKGDYIKFALPSLLAIFYNLNAISSREYLPKLLDTPVSLQKHIIRLAFTDLESGQLAEIFSNLWQTSKNKTIRCMIFEFTFNLLCKTKDTEEAKRMWEKFEVFVNDLSFEEDKKNYERLSKVQDVPDNIKSHFLVKSYEFLKRLIPNMVTDRSTYEWYVEMLEEYISNIMEQMNTQFVEKLIAEYLEKMFDTTQYKSSSFRSSYRMINIISAYLLTAKDIESQNAKQIKVLEPLIARSFDMWNEFKEGSYFVRENFQKLLTQLSSDLNTQVTSRKMLIPSRMFTDILTKLNKLPISENYIMITKWKLSLSITKLLETTTEEKWNSKCVEISEAFAQNCLEYLKQDVKTHFQCIYILFSKALQEIINLSSTDDWKWLVYEKMLSDKDFIQGYLAVNYMLPTYESYETELMEKVTKITDIIKEHPSVEVKMHYYYKFGEGKRGNGRNCMPWGY